MVPGAARAFRAHSEWHIFGRELPEKCALDHPKAAPAFLENEQQVKFATGLRSEVVWTVWTGVILQETDPYVYGDFANTRTVHLKRKWFAPRHGYSGYVTGLPCVRLVRRKDNVTGLDFNACDCPGCKHGYLCEYELLG